jgi:hypothetical protein
LTNCPSLLLYEYLLRKRLFALKISRIAILIILIMSIISLTSILHAEDLTNILKNSGFEEGTANWSTYGGSLSLVESPVQSGSYAVALNSDAVSTIWVHQTVPIQGGESYTFCGYALKNDPNIESVFLRISWYESEDGFGTEMSHNDSLTTLTDDQPQYLLLTTNEATAPSNARSARVKAIVVPHAATPATVYFDEFSFVGPAPTPSPTPTVTSALTPTPTPTLELTPIPTPTPKPLPTPTPTQTQTPTPTLTLTPSPSPTPNPTLSPTLTTTPTPPTATPSNEGDVVINEVQYDPPQQGIDTAFEWIEVLNRTGQTIDLTGWSLNDNHESDPVPSLSLPPGDFAVIAARTDFYANFPNFGGNIVFMADGSIGNGLSNTGIASSWQTQQGRLSIHSPTAMTTQCSVHNTPLAFSFSLGADTRGRCL